jgi:hypothetical protein
MSIIFVNAYETDNDTMHGASREAQAAEISGAEFQGVSGTRRHVVKGQCGGAASGTAALLGIPLTAGPLMYRLAKVRKVGQFGPVVCPRAK